MRIRWENIEVKLRSVGRFCAPEGVEVDPTWCFWKNDNMLCYIVSGRGGMELPQGRIELKPGVCLWLRPGFEYRHWQQPARPLSMYSVHFDLQMTDGRLCPGDMPLPPELLSPPDKKYVERVMERLVVTNPEWLIWGTAMPPLARKKSNCLLTALLMELDATAPAEPPSVHRTPPSIAHVNDIIRRIYADPTQFNSVADMARELRYTHAYFTRLFQQVHSISPKDALILSRLRHAAQMLLETKLPLKEIARRLKYCDVYFFIHQFRRRMGTSPTQYRKNPPKVLYDERRAAAHKKGVPYKETPKGTKR